MVDHSQTRIGKPTNLWRAAFILLAAAAGGIYFLVSQRTNTQTYQGVELNEAAPEFQLTDQNGATVALADFRGKIAILSFMDTKCIDTCPLTAHHFVQTYQQLNDAQKAQVVFLGINVNLDAASVEDVNKISQAWRLNEIPQWHFLTGSAELLEPVWQGYYVSVVGEGAEHEALTHTPGTYIIDPLGQMRWYVSTPYAQNDSEWIPPLYEILLSHVKEILQENT